MITNIITVVLGLNFTFFIQLILFIIGCSFLNQLVFVPYFEAYQKRLKETSTTDNSFLEYEKKTEEIEKKYQDSARKINETIKDVYEKNHEKSLQECQHLVGDARQMVQQQMKKEKEEIESQQKIARSHLKAEMPSVVAEISKKMLES